MTIVGGLIYAAGIVAVYLMALEMLNLKPNQRRPTAAAIAVIWPLLLIVALVFLSADAIELAWRKKRVASRRGDRL